MKCIVVDDEPLARKGMQLLIEQLPDLELLASFSNALDADEYMKSNEVDILFLDIQMPKLNGMEFIKSGRHNARIIITTAYPQFAVEAFELDVTDYLVKPIRFERFYKAIKKIASADDQRGKKVTADDENYIFIRTERKYIRTSYHEMDYIEALKDYVIIHCGSERHVVAANLKSISSSLPAGKFLRINKSFIVNVSKLKAVDNDHVLINNKQLPIGDIYKKDILQFISNQKVLKRE